MKNPCLVIIDVQEKLFPVMSEKESFLKNLIVLIKGFQLFDLPIIVTEQVPEKLGNTISQVSSLFENMEPITKSSFSCVGEPKFKRSMDLINPNEIILTGIETHVCVYQTTKDLLKQNMHVEIITDAVSSRKHDNHEIALQRMNKEGAGLNTVEMMLFSLQEKAEGVTFKKLVRLVK